MSENELVRIADLKREIRQLKRRVSELEDKCEELQDELEECQSEECEECEECEDEPCTINQDLYDELLFCGIIPRQHFTVGELMDLREALSAFNWM